MTAEYAGRAVDLVRTETERALREASATVVTAIEPDHLVYLLDLLDDQDDITAHLLRIQFTRDLMRYRR